MGGDHYSVVVVDDAPDVRGVVNLQLRLSGRFEVVGEGGSGWDAVELASQHQPAILVMDASMPGMDGLEAIPEVLRVSPATRVVMLSGFESGGLGDTALSLGAVAYIEKSTPMTELPARLLTLLGQDIAGPDVSEADPVRRPPTPGGTAGDEAALPAEHLERFRTVFDQAAIGMATLTLTGSVVRANRALAQLVGEDETKMVGLNFAQLADDVDREDLAGAVHNAAVNPSAASVVEHRLRSGPGQRWARTTLGAVRESGGRALYLLAQIEDATLRHNALEELRASEERFRLMVESVQDYAIFMLDPDGRVTTWNRGAERMKGYRADEIIGRHFRTFYPPEAQQVQHPERELAIAIREGRYEEEGWRVRKDGSPLWANVVITALFDDEQQLVGFAKVTRDMTERRRAQDERERAAARLAETNVELHAAAQQTEEFLAVTAHELQSPVAAINGAADILLEYWDRLDDRERRETLRRITAGGTRIRRLLEDLLTASRLDAGSFSVNRGTVVVQDVVSQAIDELAGSVEDIAVAGFDGLTVQGDPARLVQILTNLLINAAKYGEPPISVDARRVDDWVEIRVMDSGAGVEPDLVPRLFEKFAGTSRSGTSKRGTGLGLFIVRELARKQGGDAWYEPGPAFAVRLPAVP